MTLHDVTEVFDDGHNTISKLEVLGGWIYT